MTLQKMTLDRAQRIGRCDRCKRRVRKDPEPNVVMRDGCLVGWICSRCQTDEDRAEAFIHESTIDYSTAKLDPLGRLTARPR